MGEPQKRQDYGEEMRINKSVAQAIARKEIIVEIWIRTYDHKSWTATKQGFVDKRGNPVFVKGKVYTFTARDHASVKAEYLYTRRTMYAQIVVIVVKPA
jgi:hypothetical protein